MQTCKLKVKCRFCEHDRGVITSPTGNLHAGRIDCANCGGFLKWISKSDLDLAQEKGLVNTPIDGCQILR